MIVRRLVLGLALWLACTAPAQATTIYANDFESCAFDSSWSTTWLTPSRIFHTSDMNHTDSSGCAVQLHYPDVPDAMTRGEGAATDRSLSGAGKHMRMRYWVYFSNDFQVSPVSTKWLYGFRTESAVNLAGPGALLVMVGNMRPFLQVQGAFYPDGYYATPFDRVNGVSTAPAQNRGEWACYEYEIYLGSSEGASDGYLKLWKNETLIGSDSGLPLWVAGSGNMDNIAFYQERGIGDIWYDDIVITTGEYIGCGGSFTPTPPPPPGPPPPPPSPTPPPPPSGSPGTVSNLSASPLSNSSLTLSFTTVSDGAGGAAKYEIRYYQGSSMDWGAAPDVSSGTCTVPYAPGTTGANTSCTITGLLGGTQYTVQLVAYRGTLNVDAVFGSLSNTAAAVTSDPDPYIPPDQSGSCD